MLEAMMKYEIIYYLMGLVVGIGVFAKVISYMATKKLVSAASEIQKSNHRLMRLVKAKFEHASMVSDKVQNVEAFVQRYLYEYRVLMVQLHTWRTLPVKYAWVTALLGIVGVAGSYRMNEVGETIFQYGSTAAIGTVVLLCFYMLGDEKVKLEAVKNYMVEYLENVCVHRYEKANQKENEPEEEKAVQIEKEEEKATIQEEVKSLDYRAEQEMRIRAILEEFLA